MNENNVWNIIMNDEEFPFFAPVLNFFKYEKQLYEHISVSEESILSVRKGICLCMFSDGMKRGQNPK